MYALNFYSPIVADQLRSRRKTATIRLGDKSKKYKKGMARFEVDPHHPSRMSCTLRFPSLSDRR